LISEAGLPRLAGRSDEITQYGNVWAVRANAPGIHGQTEPLGKIEIHTCVVQFRQTETLRRQNAIQARRIDRPRRAVTPPGAPRQLVKLFPIAFVPSRHFLCDPDPLGANLSASTFPSTLWMHARPRRFTRLLPRIPFQGTAPLLSGLFIYSIIRMATYFPCLLFQTRYGTNCFAHQARENRPGASSERASVVLRLASHRFGYTPRHTTHIRAYRPARRPVRAVFSARRNSSLTSLH